MHVQNIFIIIYSCASSHECYNGVIFLKSLGKNEFGVSTNGSSISSC
uniref:Uncharacterized protein n=1 Tax=Rhizophora mucronata TaxID=61149 RepID=A0A2P2QND8_RHIMU